jgi:hypothetical protein
MMAHHITTVFDRSSEHYGSFEQSHFPQSFGISSAFSGVHKLFANVLHSKILILHRNYIL